MMDGVGWGGVEKMEWEKVRKGRETNRETEKEKKKAFFLSYSWVLF